MMCAKPEVAVQLRTVRMRKLLIVVASLLVIGVALPDDIGDFDILVEKAAVVARLHGIALPQSITTTSGVSIPPPHLAQNSATPTSSNTLTCISACVLRC